MSPSRETDVHTLKVTDDYPEETTGMSPGGKYPKNINVSPASLLDSDCHCAETLCHWEAVLGTPWQSSA